MENKFCVHINVSEIETIEKTPERINFWYVFKEASSFLGLLGVEQGFYNINDDKIYLPNNNKFERYDCENIYIKPNIVITLKSGRTIEKWFDSNKELNDFYIGLTQDICGYIEIILG